MKKLPKRIGPFNFEISMTQKQRQRRILIEVLSLIILLSVFLYGYITVYKNSYNVMNNEPMTVFSVDTNDDGYTITVMNNKFEIKK